MRIPLDSQRLCSAYSADTGTGSESSSACGSSSSVSLLDRLRAQAPSALARKHKVGVNSAPPIGKKRSSGQALKTPMCRKESLRPSEHLNFLGNNLLYQVESSSAKHAKRFCA